MAGNKFVFMADFETTPENEHEVGTRVWAWACCSLMAESAFDVDLGNSIESFFQYIAKGNSITYFHNLAFDGVFILDKLFREGFKHTDGFLRKGEFSTLIDGMGKFYSITVRWRNGTRTEFRDSLKKMNMPVAKIAKSFKLPFSKGDLDHSIVRPVGHELTREERSYIARDVLIPAKALRMEFEQGMTRLTTGADSLAEYKKLMSPKYFNRLFPVLSDDMDSDIRQAYRGGFTYADPRFSGKLQGEGHAYDVNSLYPSVMYNCVLPYGEPLHYDGPPLDMPEYSLWIGKVTFTAKLKKDHIPCIQIKRSLRFNGTEYQRVIKEPVTLWLTNVDLELWQEQYDLNILSWDEGYLFQGAEGFFDSYIDKWMKVKAESEGGMREIAKLHLNSLYGKFATNPDKTGKVPVFRDDRVEFEMGPEEISDPVYTAMGVFITAYARALTVRAAQAHYPVFAYADTDSLHILGEPRGLDVHPTRLGAWKHEYRFTQALYVRAKAYTELREDGRQETHIAGVPDPVVSGCPEDCDKDHRHREALGFGDFTDGRVFHGSLKARRVPGGVVLRETDFTLKF